ncbi:MAG TPA: DUF551 domain-containing protein [Hanamia sp.]|jgi:Protein of unknown function (DUF551).|nr:DUF551 domain-containing protein [Hanamia sp.]
MPKENVWISVKDYSPKEDGRYIVCETYKSWHWIGVCSLRDGYWDNSNVTHWMNLPEKPND